MASMRSGMAGKDVAVMLGASSAALVCNWVRVAEDSSPRSGGQEPRRTYDDGFFDCLKYDSAHLLYNKCAVIGETI